jgi:hypothetical protein
MCAITDVGEVDYFDSAQDERRRHDDDAIVPSAKHMMQR